MRLIDADYMLHKMETTKEQPITEMEHYAFDFGKELLRQSPTVDAVPISVVEDIKAEIIHSIAKQYSEHNEVVPPWLSIGDISGKE